MASNQWEASIFEFIYKIGIRIQKEVEIKITTMEYWKAGFDGSGTGTGPEQSRRPEQARENWRSVEPYEGFIWFHIIDMVSKDMAFSAMAIEIFESTKNSEILFAKITVLKNSILFLRIKQNILILSQVKSCAPEIAWVMEH